ncbi:hypothetical protein E2C01_021801 [Portunus trituberculatus]|uniref:Uncharacterized protein n=1 Tax=Portunus trituberculatus TaxID=210409 RepID=A0A5B7E765_PORTR|nr:hypothetical protein [Portunus trituberculatus]
MPNCINLPSEHAKLLKCPQNIPNCLEIPSKTCQMIKNSEDWPLIISVDPC